MKIGLVIHGLSGGGAERLLCNLAEGFIAEGHEVVVLTFDLGESDFYLLPPGCRRVRIAATSPSTSLLGALRRNAGNVWRLSRAMRAERIDVAVGFLTRINILTVLAARLAGKIPTIITEHVSYLRDSVFWRAGIRFTYPKAQALVSVSVGVDADHTRVPQSRRRVIPNLIEVPPTFRAVPTGKTQGLHFVTMGRLTEQKNHRMLIAAFGAYRGGDPSSQLTIVGGGPLEASLKSLVSELGLSEHIHFPGALSSPFDCLAHADVFVLSSDFEGFGNVVVEALCLGLPVISTDCPHGPAEILEGGYGLLVACDDSRQMAEAMATLASNPGKRSELAARAPQRAKAYCRESIIPQWLALFDEVCIDS